MNLSKGNYAIFIFLVLISCSSDLELHKYSSPKPVCYCLLNLDSKDQFVRLSQSFQLDSYENNIFSSATVYVEEWDENSVVEKFSFNKLSNETNKNTGQDYAIWHTSFVVKPNTLYKLYVWLPESKLMMFGETQTISNPIIINPLSIPGRSLTINNDNKFVASFIPGNGAAIFRNGFRFQYQQTSGNYFLDNISRIGSANQVNSYFKGEDFLELIRNELPIVDGELLRVEYELISAGEELALLDLTYNQDGNYFESLYDYSNLINGIGIFSSISTTLVTNLDLSPLTINLLNKGGYGLYENNIGTVFFNFPLRKRQGINENRLHRVELSIAYSSDSLAMGEYIRSANVSDVISEYSFPLPPGEYVYKAGIICTALGDSCLWGGFPGGRFGSLWTSGKFRVEKEKTTEVKIQLQQ